MTLLLFGVFINGRVICNTMNFSSRFLKNFFDVGYIGIMSCNRCFHASNILRGKGCRKWDEKLRIATGTIIKRNKKLLPESEKLDVSIPEAVPPVGVVQEDGGIRYHGFVYYPHRDAEGQPIPDPELIASPLHRVELIKVIKGQPYWVRDTLTELGFQDFRLHSHVVLINSATVNAKLYVAKHMVKIDPVTFPEGVPTRGDLDGWRLLEDGRVVRCSVVTPVQTDYRDFYHIDKPLKDKRLHLRWIRPFHIVEKRTF